MEGDWRNSAACLRADPELFFPAGETSKADIDQINRAKSFCVSCLVQVSCFEYASEQNQDFGVWGNTTDSERRALKRKAWRNGRA